MKASEDLKERERAGNALLAHCPDVKEIHEIFIALPSLRGQAISRFFEIADSPELVQGKLKIWHLEDARRIAQILQ